MTHLKVGVRVRPMSRREVEGASCAVLDVEDDGKTVAVTNIKVPEQNAGDSRERTRRFTFDFCFGEASTQNDVFQAVEGIVAKTISKRCHSCVLAYGQSASGKTHTMMGFPHDPGLTPRLCERVFHYLEETAVGDEMVHAKLSVSYFEIYNEKVRDLLDDNKGALRVRQHPKRGTYVEGLTRHSASDTVTLLQLLSHGNGNRRVGATLTNPQSSRSHSVFVVEFNGAKLTLVDLAGSERASNRCNSTLSFREGANINKSLVALGNVISALAEDAVKTTKGIRRRFVPFRDSVLTWLLKDTLGGDSDTVMIATVSPASDCYSETVNTLRFGQRAKLIVSFPVVHEDPKERIIRELRAEIARLKELLQPGQVTMSRESVTTTDKLIPVMNVTNDTPTPRLRRTLSIDHSKKPEIKAPTRKYGSEETISRRIKPNSDKTSVSEAKAKVDSIRRNSLKPRSQIVAAVTHRLYAKTKKKDASTDTSDIPTGPPKELSICSNARLQLKELTRKALKAHKYKSEETQTELFPVLRVKETSTDVSDLQPRDFKHVETSTDGVRTEDKETSCAFLDSISNAFMVTRSCGTQSQTQSSVSFTKYLQEPPKLEIMNPHTANPIYTSSVNINISHNYINAPKVVDNVSDDSLDDQTSVCFPTPDLISNHNSLEPHAHATTSKEPESKLWHANIYELSNQDHVTDFVQDHPLGVVAACSTVECHKKVNINIPCVYAPVVCLQQQENNQQCQTFTPQLPEEARPKIIESKSYSDDCITLVEPLVLKSIMRQEPQALDSLEYHKRVRFNKSSSSSNERMMKAMSSFLEEATILMNNLKSCTQEHEYEVQVSIDGLEHKRKRKRRILLKNATIQTEAVVLKSDYIQTDEVLELDNKYEMLLRDSCRRLEEKVAAAADYNPWDVQEDTSLESNPVTFSDYGSLPRRRRRRTSCTPSAYLKQLATMRRQVVEAAREEMSNSEASVS